MTHNDICKRFLNLSENTATKLVAALTDKSVFDEAVDEAVVWNDDDGWIDVPVEDVLENFLLKIVKYVEDT